MKKYSQVHKVYAKFHQDRLNSVGVVWTNIVNKGEWGQNKNYSWVHIQVHMVM